MRVSGWVFALVFILVFGWALGCVLDLLGLLRGCAAEILRRYGREESFGDGYRSLFDMRGVGWMSVCVLDSLGVFFVGLYRGGATIQVKREH